MISYAQNREDVLLARVFPPGLAGFYVDVGAHDPTYNSITRHFYDQGWHGINVEPAAEPFRRLEQSRDRDVNLNMGLSDEAGTLPFYEGPPDAGVSTFSAAQADAYREAGFSFAERAIEVTTLAQVCEKYVDGTIDFLSIDVEGHELEVLRGGDWSRWRPRVVVVEATRPGTPVASHEQWEPVLVDAGYVYATFDGLNRFYVRGEERDLAEALRTPVNIFDDYVPYEHARQVRELADELAASRRRVAAAEVLTQTLRAQVREGAHLRSQFENLTNALASLEAQYDDLRTALADAESRFERLRVDIIEARMEGAAGHGALAEVGPAGLAVARRLSRVSSRFPRTAAVAKKGLRGTVRAARRLRPPASGDG